MPGVKVVLLPTLKLNYLKCIIREKVKTKGLTRVCFLNLTFT